MAFWSWSKTAANNANADTTINWAEGQSPSSVNDSARAMMARIAEWRDDLSGTIATGGTATAFTVTSYEGFDTLGHLDKQVIAFTPHATNTGTCTLNVDGLGAKPLRSAPGVELPSGTLILGTPYTALYNNSDGAFYLHNFSGIAFTIPIGMMAPWVGTSVPNSNFAFPAGQAISRTTYATLFALTGITYGTGDGSTTFNIPDLRGRVIAGLDNPGGLGSALRINNVATDNGTIDSRNIGQTGGSSTHTQTGAEVGPHNHTITDSGHSHAITNVYENSGAANVAAGVNFAVTQTNKTSSTVATNISINNSAAASAMALLQPTIILPYVLRVL